MSNTAGSILQGWTMRHHLGPWTSARHMITAYKRLLSPISLWEIDTHENHVIHAGRALV